jgi:hypothetical protein
MAHLTAVVGFNVPLTAAFTNAAGEPVAPDTRPILTVRDADRKILYQLQLLAGHDVSTGAYLVNYLVPEYALPFGVVTADITAEFVAPVGGIPSIGERHTITVTWT